MIGQGRGRRIVAHCTQGLHPVGRHRGQQDAQLLERVAEYLLPFEQRVVFHARHLDIGLRDFIQADHVLVQPRAVGMDLGHRLLQLLIGDDAALIRVHQKHAPRFQARFPQDAIRFQRQHARLGCHDHHVVLGDTVARGTQPVAVQHGTHDGTIGKDHRCRPVPWLHHRAVILVKRLFGIAH